MISFLETRDGYVFTKDTREVAVGAYDNGSFELLHGDDVLSFSNAIQAFIFLRSRYDTPPPVSANTMAVFTKPAPPSATLSNYKHHSTLDNIGHARYAQH